MTEIPPKKPAGDRLAEVDEIEVQVEKLVEGGDGLARFEGIPIFVPRSAPGDRLRVRLVDRKAGYGRAEILEILTAGKGRRDPPCPHFERCGSCSLQHLEESVQLKSKAEAVRETLRRLGDVETLPKVTVVPGLPWGYRLRAQLYVENAEHSSPEVGRLPGEGVESSPEGGQVGSLPEEGEVESSPEGGQVESPPEGGQVGSLPGEGVESSSEGGGSPAAGQEVQVGFFARGSHDLEPVEQCPVLVPELENNLAVLTRALGGVSHRRVDLTAGDDSRWTVSPPVEGLPQGGVETRIGDFVYTYDARCFFQSHRQLIPALIEHALGPETGDEQGTAYDLFAGVGLFSLPLARRFDRVIAVEGDRIANRFAKKNARLNGIKNLTIERQSVESWIRLLPPKRALVIVDPPRLGLTHQVRRALVERRPRRLTYVSCHAATLARDLKQMSRGFRIESLALLDMFPQTGHMEAVVQLVDRDS